ncbi:MAG: LysR substrate-binding domain-containing protein [Hydrogenophaga sp.]|jgi:DNA-binding transcriptional LysR family regulator|uniref:LysR substrate-binding domain-containing protein n=1 Tax=Hydrogenophaga sp. TaxID=1904254 RepID=UPI001DF43B06|nr:LysR substrate-binding domain-containing protein [Hydrogenophaga sp.]MBW0171021.1 LysR family transcriptional regulator [Hydrogenophaga sp.]MBW0184998.1 LysR family transcriptional regulator [Hydrogenophaga sp.]
MQETIDLSTLRVVIAAADLGSISAASERLQLAVAAASARITALEESLGFRVFERSSRGVQLTPAGQMLVQRSRALLTDADRLAQHLRGYSEGLQGHVRVLANTSALLEVLPQRLEQFMKAHPLIRIDLEERGSPEIPLALIEGRADFGVVDLPVPPAGLTFTPFFTDTLVLLTPRTHRLASRRRLRLADALDEPFITLTDGTALSNRLLASAADAGRALNVRMRMRGFDAVCRMVAAGLGVGVLPLEAVAPQLAHLPLSAVPLSDAWAQRTHHIATRTDAPPAPAALTLIRALTN